MKPIIFSTYMVRKILSGEKTQTRRVVKPQPEVVKMGLSFRFIKHCHNQICHPDEFPKIAARYAPYKPGDVLWVRETWNFHPTEGYCFKVCNNGQVFCDDGSAKWRPSIYMPRSAARIFLKVTSVRVERVRDISINDCIKEGIENVHGFRSEIRNWYSEFWDSLNAKRGYSWESNPWCFVISFEIVNHEEVVNHEMA